MIHYKDKTFCASKTHKKDCNRILTSDDKKYAKELGLPIAYMNFCDEVLTNNQKEI